MESNNNSKINTCNKIILENDEHKENDEQFHNFEYNSVELPPISEITLDNFSNIFNGGLSDIATNNYLNTFDNLEYINNWGETIDTKTESVLFNNLFKLPLKINPPIITSNLKKKKVISEINPYTHELKIKYAKKNFRAIINRGIK